MEVVPFLSLRIEKILYFILIRLVTAKLLHYKPKKRMRRKKLVKYKSLQTRDYSA